MNLSSYKIFCDLAETASFSRTAEMNGVTQSAVSQQIRALERNFQATLIERGRKSFALTPEGELLMGAARRMLAICEEARAGVRRIQRTVAGALRVAAVHSIGLHELPPLLRLFREKFPDVRVETTYCRSAQVYAEVLDGGADLGLVAFPQKRKGLVVDSHWRDRLVLICPPGHPLARKERVLLADLDQQAFVAFEADLPTRRELDRIFRENGVEVTTVAEFENVETVKRVVQNREGVSIVPLATVLQERRGGQLVAREIEAEGMWRSLGVIRKRTRPLGPSQKAFLALLHKENFGLALLPEDGLVPPGFDADAADCQI